MALKVNIGVTKKLGQANYSSVGASINIEFEADAELLRSNPEAFQDRISQVYETARIAVDEELARSADRPAEPAAAGAGAPRNGQTNGYTKERHEWNSRRTTEPDRPARSDDRSNDRSSRGGERRGGYGPPTTGKALFAWARKQDEDKGIASDEDNTFFKRLARWAKDKGIEGRFNEFSADEVRATYEAGRRMLESN